MLCVGGGVLLATVFVHMLPEVRESLENSAKKAKKASHDHDHDEHDHGYVFIYIKRTSVKSMSQMLVDTRPKLSPANNKYLT